MMTTTGGLAKYRIVAAKVAGKLNTENVAAIKYMCAGRPEVTRVPLEEWSGVNTGYELVRLLEQYLLIEPALNNWTFLVERLNEVGEDKLASYVDEYAKEETKKLEQLRRNNSGTSTAMKGAAMNLANFSFDESTDGPATCSNNKLHTRLFSPLSLTGRKSHPGFQRQAVHRSKSQPDCLSSENDTNSKAENAWIPTIVSHPDWSFNKRLAEGETSLIYRGKSVQGQSATAQQKDGDLSRLPALDVVAKVYIRSGALRDEESFLRQIRVLGKLQDASDRIVRLHAIVDDRRPAFAVLELAAYGDLRSYLRDITNRSTITVDRLMNFAAQVADGMFHIEKKGYIHGNLRASNVLLFDKDSVKISGFSLARHSDGVCDVSDDMLLPIRWLALDVILYRQFNMKSDVWSFAIFVIELFTFGEEPYKDIASNERLVCELKRGYKHPQPEKCPPLVYEDVLKPCLEIRPNDRPSFPLIRSCMELVNEQGSEYLQTMSGTIARRRKTLSSQYNTTISQVTWKVNTLYASSDSLDRSDYLSTSELTNSIWQSEWEVAPTAIGKTAIIGKGQFGSVWKGRLQTVHGDVDVAIKTFDKRSIDDETFMKEARFLIKVKSHPHVVQLYGFCTSAAAMFIVMELMPLGDLRNYLRKDQGTKLLQSDLVHYAAEIADAMSYIETINAIHRDIAARNVLVADNGNNVKLSDFGLARFLVDSEYSLAPDLPIPVRWTAVEVFETRQFSIKSDVWSFGILLYELFTFGEVPYAGLDQEGVMQDVKLGMRLRRPENCPENVYQLMVDCWLSEPADRPTFSELHNSLLAMRSSLASTLNTCNGHRQPNGVQQSTNQVIFRTRRA